MKYCYLLCCALLCFSFTHAQTPIENGDFEDWGFYDLDANGEIVTDYEVPGGYWATNNRLLSLSSEIPLIVSKEETEVVSGSYAAKLTSTKWGNFPVAALLGSGEFEPNLADPVNSFREGTPFTDRPDRFDGYYMYFPVGPDEMELYTYLTKWNVGINDRDTIAEAYLSNTNEVSEYTKFELSFEYYSEENPDTAIIVFTPSIEGDLVPDGYVGDGSTLYIDNLSFFYEGNSIDEIDNQEVVKVYPVPASERLFFEYENVVEATLTIYSLDGKTQSEQTLYPGQSEINITGWTTGAYMYRVVDKEGNLQTGQFGIVR